MYAITFHVLSLLFSHKNSNFATIYKHQGNKHL